MLLIVVCSALSYGAYVILEKPLFAARSFYGFGVLVAILGIIAINGKTANYMGKLACILLGWSLIVFSLAYGNALAEQKRYETFRAHILLNDVSKIPGLDRNNVMKMQLKGNVGYSPVLQRMQKRYPILNLLVNIQLKEGYCFGEFYLFNYFPYWSLWVNFHAYEKDTYINRKESGHYLLGSVKFLALRSMG